MFTFGQPCLLHITYEDLTYNSGLGLRLYSQKKLVQMLLAELDSSKYCFHDRGRPFNKIGH